MRALALVLLLAVAAAATSSVGVDELVGATARVGDEVDSILARARHDLLHLSPASPPAPHVASASAPVQVSLVETSTSTKATVGHVATAHRASSARQQQQQQKKTTHARQQQQRKARATYNPNSDVMKKLREIMPQKVVLGSRYPKGTTHQVDEIINASEVLPKDPDADDMLAHFNKKYRVYDQLGISSLVENRSDLPDKDLFNESLDGLTETQRDYKSIYAGANTETFNPEKDNPSSLDNMLGTLWSKRWESLDSDAKDAQQQSSKELVTRITPAFNEEMIQDGHDSSIGKVYTTAGDKAEDPAAAIENRKDFVPRQYWYGPRVFDSALDTTRGDNEKEGVSAPPRPPVESFTTPQYDGSPDIKTIETIHITGAGTLSEPAPVAENIFHPEMETHQRLLNAKKVWVLDDASKAPSF